MGEWEDPRLGAGSWARGGRPAWRRANGSRPQPGGREHTPLQAPPLSALFLGTRRRGPRLAASAPALALPLFPPFSQNPFSHPSTKMGWESKEDFESPRLLDGDIRVLFESKLAFQPSII